MNYPQLSATGIYSIRNSPYLHSSMDVSATIRNWIVRDLQPIPFIFVATKQTSPSSDMLYLPTEEKLQRELQKKRKRIEEAKMKKEC